MQLFKAKHEQKSGLKVVNRTAASVIDSVECQFCRFYGQDESICSKRNVRRRLCCTTGSFRHGNYATHLNAAHPLKCNEHNNMDNDVKRSFFASH